MPEKPSRRNDRGRERNRGHRSTNGSPRGSRQYSAQAPSQRRRTSDPARLAAFEVLRAVSADDAYANLVLPRKIRDFRLDKRDAGFATELTYGALRAQGTYDAILSRNVDRPLKDLDPAVLDALRLGVHQVLAMRVPTHAALNETVALVRQEIGAGPAGLVNAVLRKVSEKPLDGWLTELTESAPNEAESLGLSHAHPAWIVRAFKQALTSHGRPESELLELLEADNEAPVVNLVALPGLGSLEEAESAGATPGELVDGSALWSGGDPARLDSIKSGTVRVQDVGSQLVARALADVEVHSASTVDGTAPTEKWLDMCAGPGGKSALLGAIAAERGAHLSANEPSAHRAELVRNALAAVPERAWDVQEKDGQVFGEETPETFDRILVDAPCTGLGALRRRPESRWRRQPSDVGQLIPIQEALLSSAIQALKPGGVVAYVTCSPHHGETDLVVQEVLSKLGKDTDLTLLDAPAALNEVAKVDLAAGNPQATPGEGATAQIWPHLHHTDGMYLALIRKNAKESS
ncbi:RsmB/NOP family class I SAM-dependent RNA methyltransferase [Haematomicrobium sanguinis]|uniref:RsmB/NOP family class I SAM-dependent RNA methyltransferase n=1 Tax=Haematomicrobium sanguinis TaxID=479106 RepID=UPI000A6D9706|nr:transcription antitermination factor NusB [Haematomicrobium sanguinis]